MQAAAGHLLPAAAAAVLPQLGGRRRKEVLPLEDVLALPTVCVPAGGAGLGRRKELDDALAFFPPTPPASPARKARGFENDICAICLSDFEAGEVLKVLPCGGHHAFHAECITPWLTERARTCPLCKVKLTPSSSADSSSSSSSSVSAAGVGGFRGTAH
jgi:hypothetical protein